MNMALVLAWLSFSELYSHQFEILLKHSRSREHEYKSFRFKPGLPKSADISRTTIKVPELLARISLLIMVRAVSVFICGT